MTRRTIELLAFAAALLVAALAFNAWLASHDEQQRLQATLSAQKQLLTAADSREHDRNAALNDTLGQIAKLKTTTQTPEEILRNLQLELSLPQPITLTAANSAAAQPQAKSASNAIGITPAACCSVEIRSGESQTRPLPGPASNSEKGTPASANPPPTSQGAPSATLNAPQRLSSSDNQQEKFPAAPAAQIPSADLKPLFDYVQDCRACQAQLAVAKQNSADDAAKITALTRERDAAITASKGGTFWRRFRRNALWLAAGAAAGYVAAKR